MKSLWFSLLLGWAPLLAAQPTPAAPPTPPAPVAAYPEHIADTIWDIRQDMHDYRIFIKVIGEAPASGYPVVYLLDGNALFDAFAQARIALPAGPMILVGLGYPTPYRFSMNERAWDYTPPRADGSPDPDPLKPERMGGGADAFYQFIENTIKPRVAQNWHINTGNQTLYGHSYGGLFALYSLLQHPQAFQQWIIVSPSTWRSGPILRPALQSFAMQASRIASRVLLLNGSREQTARDTLPERAVLAQSAPSFADIGSALSSRMPVQSMTLPGKNHGAMIDAGLIDGLTWLTKDLPR